MGPGVSRCSSGVIWFLIRGWIVGTTLRGLKEKERTKSKRNAEAQSSQRKRGKEEPKSGEKRVGGVGA
jgi:hypothetical protein